MKLPLTFSNLKDATYRNILIFSLLGGVLMQAVLVPTLDYIALTIKHDNQVFYNYATIATLAATLPQALSLLISYFVNNFSFRKVLVTGLSILLVSGSIILFIQHIFIIYVSWIILCGVIFNALYLNLSRQICALFATKIKDYQSDSFILGAIGNILGYQFGNLTYNYTHLSGIIIVFFAVCLAMFLLVRKIKFNTIIEEARAQTPNLKQLYLVLRKQKQLLMFLGFMFSIILVGSGLNLFLVSKIHQLHLNNTIYSNFFTLMTIGSMSGALLLKNPKVQHLNNLHSLITASCLFLISYLFLANSATLYCLHIIAVILGFANSLFLINMNTICMNFINRDQELLKIAPIVNGFMMSGFYGVSLLGPLIYNHLLQTAISLNLIIYIITLLQVIIIAGLFVMVKQNRFKI